jgi:hypothetical protein
MPPNGPERVPHSQALQQAHHAQSNNPEACEWSQRAPLSGLGGVTDARRREGHPFADSGAWSVVLSPLRDSPATDSYVLGEINVSSVFPIAQ